MKTFVRLACVVIVCAWVGVTNAAAQPAPTGCSSDHPPNSVQTLRCPGKLTIVAEDGARFTLQSADKAGSPNSVDLQSKALLIDAPKQRGKRRFQVTTPQAIAWWMACCMTGTAALTTCASRAIAGMARRAPSVW